MQFDLRNGSLRKKFDSVKYTLKKLEVSVGPLGSGACWCLQCGLCGLHGAMPAGMPQQYNGSTQSCLQSLICCADPLQNTLYELTLAEATGLGMRDKDVAEDAEVG